MSNLKLENVQPGGLTHDDLEAIADDASSLWARLTRTRPDQLENAELESCIDQWCNLNHADRDRFRTRQSWARLRRTEPGPADPTTPKPPHWTDTLSAISAESLGYRSERIAAPGERLPFEELFTPTVRLARQRVLNKCAERGVPDVCDTTEASAFESLERALLVDLSRTTAPTLYAEFRHQRPFGNEALSLLLYRDEGANETDSPLESEATSSHHYVSFVERNLADGLRSLLLRYPVLARLIALRVDFWIDAAVDFFSRLASDLQFLPSLAPVTATAERAPGPVVEIRANTSDSHHNGRSVFLVRFESGLQVLYKPRPLGIDSAFYQFVQWHNQLLPTHPLRAPAVIERQDYGWVEHIDHAPCKTEEEVQRFYECAGQLLCLLYLLRATDCHHDNVIASGNTPVLVDIEALLHNEPANDAEDTQPTTSIADFSESVLRTSFLPGWCQSGSDENLAYDFSALGSTEPQRTHRQCRRWIKTNTDDMCFVWENAVVPVANNVVRLRDDVQSPNDYVAEIVRGFRLTYNALLEQRKGLLNPKGPLACFRNQEVRFVFRSTSVYDSVLEWSLSPEFMSSGAKRSVAIDSLSQAFFEGQPRDSLSAILEGEVQSIDVLDIPRFTANSSNTDFAAAGQPVDGFFRDTGFDKLLGQVRALSERDLVRQVSLIEATLHARVAHLTAAGSCSRARAGEREAVEPMSPEQLINAAKQIAADIEANAILEPDGSVSWLGLGYLSKADRFELQVLDSGLHQGRCGIALFLAALTAADSDDYGDLALRALKPLRDRIGGLSGPRAVAEFANEAGIDAMSGVGSFVSSLVRIGSLLADRELLADALRVAECIRPESVAALPHCDVVGGTAGIILSLLPLYSETGAPQVLETLIAAGDQLLAHRVETEEGFRAWKTISDRPLTGLSHGAAGISLALLRLHQVVEDPRFLAAALEGIEYESSLFCETRGNWPDLRVDERGAEWQFAMGWCHGAPGIALARLGGRACMPQDTKVDRAILHAADSIAKSAPAPVDHACCGEAGKIEALLVAGRRLERPDLVEAAVKRCSEMAARGRDGAGYSLFPGLPESVVVPGFFQGLSGIGYQLLRVADASLPSALIWE